MPGTGHIIYMFHPSHPKADDAFKSPRHEMVAKDSRLTEFLAYSRNK